MPGAVASEAPLLRDAPGRLGGLLERAGLDPARAPLLTLAAVVAALAGVALGLAIDRAHVLSSLGVPARLDRGAALLAGLGVALVPWAWIARLVRRRREAIARDLPFILDLLVALTESGVAFDGALSKLVAADGERRPPLEEELARAYGEVQMGIPRPVAFRALGARVRLEEFDAVVAAIVQGETQGGGIAPVIRAQADALRARRLEEAREQAQRLPIRLILPLVTCVFPSIFVVTLGPSLLKVLDMLAPLARR